MSVQSVKHPPTEAAPDTRRAPRESAALDAAGEPTGTVSDAAAAERVERRVLDGLLWTFRDHFGRTLAALPAAAWTDPAGQGWQRVKDNATRAVWRARIDGTVYYLKYYVRRRWSGAFKRRWRGPACEIEWKSGVYALRAGIPAVRPVGYTDRVDCAGRTCSLLVTEAVEPAYPLNEYWETLRADDDASRRRRDTAYLTDLLAQMIARAHQAGFEHRDMHAANILVHPTAPGASETVFVDLHSARLGMPLDDRAVVRNLAQLNQWFRQHSRISDRLRFLRRYLRWRNEYEQAFAPAR
ncbi:MAG: lipopolysaccharide kinase InaA family protein, partial [Phycisphaerae bacterium]